MICLLNIDSRSSKPIYEQIISGIKENILKGILSPEDKLPSVREMASMLTVNPNTVSKAYNELEREKVIETIRGRGTFISKNYKPRRDDDKMNLLRQKLKEVIVEAHYMGLTIDEVIDIAKEIMNDIK